MLAQALQGASDLLASGLLLVGMRRSRKPSDIRAPFGYGKELYFWATVSAFVMLGLTATASIYFGVKRTLEPEPIDNIPLAIFVLGFALVTNGYSFSLSLRKLYSGGLRKLLRDFLGSPVIEVKTTFVLDLMGLLASFFGIMALLIYLYTGDSRFDGIGAILIGLTLVVLALVLLDGARVMIVGKKAPAEVEDSIINLLSNHQEVMGVVSLKTMYLGPSTILANIEIHAAEHLRASEIELLVDKLEHEIKTQLPMVKFIQIELEDARQSTTHV